MVLQKQDSNGYHGNNKQTNAYALYVAGFSSNGDCGKSSPSSSLSLSLSSLGARTTTTSSSSSENGSLSRVRTFSIPAETALSSSHSGTKNRITSSSSSSSITGARDPDGCGRAGNPPLGGKDTGPLENKALKRTFTSPLRLRPSLTPL